MKYIIVKAPVSNRIIGVVSHLESEVNKHIEEGYVPQGGIALAYDEKSGDTCIMQAMIKKE